MLFAEDFVLLALDPEGRVVPATLLQRFHAGMPKQQMVAKGVECALVNELAHEGHLEIADDKYGRISLTGTVPEHPILARALEVMARHEGKKLMHALGYSRKMGSHWWDEVIDGMVAGGVLQGREDERLTKRHRFRFPVQDTAAQATLLAEVRAAAVSEGPLDARTATLLALAGACRLFEWVVPDRADRSKAKRRFAEASEQVPAASAVKFYILQRT